MKVKNKSFFRQELFVDRVQTALKYRQMDYDNLCEVLNNEVGYEITKSNLKLYISERTININFLIALSQALRVSVSYLLGETNEEFIDGVDQRIFGRNYQKYHGIYNMYFLQTVSSDSEKVEKAKLEIDIQNKCSVRLTIDVKDSKSKVYNGNLHISETYPNAFIQVTSEFGETVAMSMFDENINNNKFQCAVGAMLSISSGSLNRCPVMSRYIITAYDVADEDMGIIRAHLKLNGSFVNVQKDEIDSIINDISDIKNADVIVERLKNVFSERIFYPLEEGFIGKTIRKDYGLSRCETDRLIAALRNRSLAGSCTKISKDLDNVIFRNTSPDKK